MTLGAAGYRVEPRLKPGQELEDMVHRRFAGGEILQDVGDVATTVYHPALVEALT